MFARLYFKIPSTDYVKTVILVPYIFSHILHRAIDAKEITMFAETIKRTKCMNEQLHKYLIV